MNLTTLSPLSHPSPYRNIRLYHIIPCEYGAMSVPYVIGQKGIYEQKADSAKFGQGRSYR